MRIVVVQRVGPVALRCQRVAAVATGGRRVDGPPVVVQIVDVGGVQIASRGRRARGAIGNTAGLDHASRRGTTDHRGVVGAGDGDGHHLGVAVDRDGRKRIAQDLSDIARLHVRIAVVQRVGPQPGGGERIGAVAFGARGRRVDRGPGVVQVIDIGRVQIAGRGGRARRAVGDTAGFEHRPGEIATDHRGVVGAVDGDGHQLLGAADRRGGERVGQRLPGVELLNGGVVVVQCVGPEPSGGERMGAEAIGAHCRRADRGPDVVRIVEVGGAQIAGRGRRAGVTVIDPAGLHDDPVGDAADHRRVVGAVDGDGHQLLGAVDREGRKRIGQRLSAIARLHGGIVVVQRVGPGASRCQRVGAELAPQRRVDGFPEVVGIVDVGRVQIAGRGRGARRAVVDAAGFCDRPVGDAVDHCSVVPAGDGDGHQLGGAVDREDRKRIGQRLPDITPLHGGIVVVQRVGPGASRCQRVAAVATGAGGRRADRRPDVVRIVEVGGAQIAGRGRRARRSVGDPAGLDHRPAGNAVDLCGVVGAVDGDGYQLLSAVDRGGGERVGQRLPDIARLHGSMPLSSV